VQATVAVVDEGILRITDFESPDPFAFYTRKRRLSVGTHDVYDLVLPELALPATALVKATGGDALRSKHLGAMAVRRVKPVALFSGIVKLDASGRGKVKLDVPEFQGSLRVMAVAFEAGRFGAGEAAVLVRDPIVLTPTLPRFLAPLDRVKVPVEVFNGTGRAGTFTLTLEASGAVKASGDASARVELAEGAQGLVELALAATDGAGPAKVVLRAEGNGARTVSTTELPVRPAATVSAEGVSLSARAGQPATFTLPRDFLPGTLKVHVTASAAMVGQFGGALQYLLAYPHGCVEQTTSRAFPLLYLKGLAAAAAPELAGDTSARYYVDAAIARLAGMLVPGGGLAYWPGGAWGYPWASVYGAHFLVEARKAGHAVDDGVMTKLLDHLTAITQRGAVPFYREEAIDLRTQAYALYVLGLAGRPNRSALLFAVEQARRARPGEGALDDETRALLGGALVLSGERARAAEVLPQTLSAARGPRRGFHSSARADALTLAVLAEVAPEHRSVPALMKALTDAAEVGRWGNTQENAFALMALGKMATRAGKAAFEGELRVGGKPVKRFTSEAPLAHVEVGDGWAGQPLEVAITGAGVAYVGFTVEGIRGGLAPPRASGLELRRTFLSRSGQRLDPTALRQGDVVVARIELRTPLASRLDDVAVVDLLPAGLEVENPRLGGESVEDWMKDRLVPDHVDLRDDRVIFFGRLAPGPAQSFYYTARAVSVGEFALPHAHAEAMYDPATQAQGSGGRAAVLARE
jgi:uncharacterized protein YfaS (alpha-2-macroglobulin family)